MAKRDDIVKCILDLNHSDLDPKETTKRWFWDIRRSGGLRLTSGGLAAMREAGIRSWAVPLDHRVITKRTILEMNRRIDWPYYISARPPELILFSDSDAVMANLYGDVAKWVNSLDSKR